MSVPKTKDILSLLQSRIALRANFLSEYAPSGATDWPAVEDQKADKKAVAEIVKLRREVNLCISIPYSVFPLPNKIKENDE